MPQGLRTLVLATKIISEDVYVEWDARYQEAGALRLLCALDLPLPLLFAALIDGPCLPGPHPGSTSTSNNSPGTSPLLTPARRLSICPPQPPALRTATAR